MEINEISNIESTYFLYTHEYPPSNSELKYNTNKPWGYFEIPSEIGIERSTITITDISLSGNAGFIPKTPLGKKLLALRENAIAEGMELLNEDEILEEVMRRRGEEYADIY